MNNRKLKQLILAILLHILSIPMLWATGQEGDLIEIDGQEWTLLGKPIDYDSICYHKLRAFLPEERALVTSNWSRYTGHWTIKENRLYLKKISIKMYDKKEKKEYEIEYDAEALKDVFRPYYTSKGICAQWHNGRIRCGRGKLIRYVHMGYDRNVAEERIFTLKKGKIVKEETFHNFKKEGMKMDSLHTEVMKRFPFHKFPELNSSPTRIIFFINKLSLTVDGHFDNCTVSIRIGNAERIEDQNNPLVKALKETLASIYPWEVFCIYNEYKSEYSGYSFGYRIPLM
jgi:hypothetical protein